MIAQSVITILILHRAFNFIGRQNAPSERGVLVFMGLIVFLAFGTTLPWFVGQIMPDVFTGFSFPSLFLLLHDSKISHIVPEPTFSVTALITRTKVMR